MKQKVLSLSLFYDIALNDPLVWEIFLCLIFSIPPSHLTSRPMPTSLPGSYNIKAEDSGQFKQSGLEPYFVRYNTL